jgi:F5/8 type C domain
MRRFLLKQLFRVICGLVILSIASPAIDAEAQVNSQQIYLQCLTNFEIYAQSIWHTSGTIPDSGYWGDGGSTGNGGIRGNSGIALAYAVLCVALPNDPQFSDRLAHVRQALNYDYNTHVTGSYNTTDGHQWGWSGDSTDWQTPLWAGSMGLACLLVQSNLPAATIQGVRRVIGSEADHRAGIAPASGHVSDTKAEEVAWQGNILALAAAWMSTSNNAPTWLLAAKKYLANTYTVANTNGDPLSNWLTTVNLYDDWALENHGFFHPTYEMVAGMSLGDSLLMARLANPSVAAELQPFAEHNVMAVWTNILAGMIMDSSDFAYPDGLDWELHDYEQCSYIAWMAAHFDDPIARWDDNRLAQLTRYRQQVNGNGEFVGPSGGGFYREAVAARRAAMAWLQWNFADYPTGPTKAPAPALENLTDVAALTCRGSNGFVSISYGPQTNGSPARIMAVVEPPAAGFPSNSCVTTPLLPGIIGLGAMGSPTSGRLVSLASNGEGFIAELQLTNGVNGTTEVYFDDTGDSVGIIEVPHPAPGFANSAAASFSTGIENDPLCGGARLLQWSNGSATIANRSGVSKNITNHWVCVSGYYGIAFGPAGYLRYTAAASYNRSGAAQDTLAFMPTNSLTPRYAVYFPGKTALDTSNLGAQIHWTFSDTNAALTFPANGGTAQISASTTPPASNGAYPPYRLGIASITASSDQSNYPPTNAVDNNLSTFWVSSGTNAGDGPTPAHPEWLKVNFPRQCAVSEFQVVPRTLNGGYGPANLQLWLNGTPATTNTMTSSGTLDVKFSPSCDATNAELYITGAYDRGDTNSPRNVQVVELNFFERAQPGTFADWQLHHFTEAQLTNAVIGSANADPDGDGVPNLLEFAVGGNPLVSDATNAVASASQISAGQFAIRFQERDSLGDVQRQFEASPDLLQWLTATPLQINVLSNLGSVSIKQAVFPIHPGTTFYRISYSH